MGSGEGGGRRKRDEREGKWVRRGERGKERRTVA